MYQLMQITNTSSSISNSRRLSRFLRGLLLVAAIFALAWFGFLPTARAVSPPPDGGYPNENTAEGEDALFNLNPTTGSENTAIGFEALFNNTTASGNTATGYSALFSNTTGSFNTANGFAALDSNSTGINNTANGADALAFNTTGSDNTATGLQALYANSSGTNNTANGVNALFSNASGGFNTANGLNALFSNTTGNNNTANGVNALLSNTTGSSDTADGASALAGNTTGINNTAMGIAALSRNTTGNSNTASGNSALLNNTTGGSNIAVGDSAGINLTTGSNNIDLGNKGVAGESNTIRLGKKGTQTATYIAGISGSTVAGGVGVLIDTNGRLGTVNSSARYKEAVKPMDKASEAILSLQPVTFRYKKDLDPDGIPQFGLVAEQVEKVNPDLVARDEKGKPYSVRYEAVNAMLLNEFLKEHRKVEEQARINQQQEATIARLEIALKQQEAQIQKVNDQLALSRPTSRLVTNK